MKINFAEIKKLLRDEQLPASANADVRESFENLRLVKHIPFLTYKFMGGICNTYEALVEFDNPEAALNAAEKNRWWGKLIITSDEKCYFLANKPNRNVYFGKRSDNETGPHNAE
jgi:hypothetical protein